MLYYELFLLCVPSSNFAHVLHLNMLVVAYIIFVANLDVDHMHSMLATTATLVQHIELLMRKANTPCST